MKSLPNLFARTWQPACALLLAFHLSGCSTGLSSLAPGLRQELISRLRGE